MALELQIRELELPQLQFGGPTVASDPKVGLAAAGPFDLRFGSARREQVSVGIVGPRRLADETAAWIDGCRNLIPVVGRPNALRREFPGFEAVFRKRLVLSAQHVVYLEDDVLEGDGGVVGQRRLGYAFRRLVDVYSEGYERLAARDVNSPDVVVMAIEGAVVARLGVVRRTASREELRRARAIGRARENGQLDFWGMLGEVEQTEEDLLTRNLRHGLKAAALRRRVPIQIVTESLTGRGTRRQDAATRAWNFAVALYYKAGGVPWRLPPVGPETCFVGISFYHVRTTQRHVVRSSLAQAFSSEGEGFAIRGEGVPSAGEQGRRVHLSGEQAYRLTVEVLDEYARRTGGWPSRVVVHKTSVFDEEEEEGFRGALRQTPLVNLVTLIPSAFRLLRVGAYPPKIGSVCTVNSTRTFLFTSGLVPELGTYPGPHVPQPFEVVSMGDGDAVDASVDVLSLTRMNWNTADSRGKWPVTLLFARRVGGILEELGEEWSEPASFKFFM